MTSHICQTPVTYERFVDYWFGDRTPVEQEMTEEQLMTCPGCGQQCEVWALETQAIGEGMLELPRSFVTPAQLAGLGERAALVDLRPGETTVQLSDKTFQVFRVSLDEALLAGLERLDVEYLKEGYADPIFHVSSVPLAAEAGRLHFACHSHVLDAHGDAIMRLVGTRNGERFTVIESLVRFV